MVTGVSLDAMQSYLDGEAMELFCSKFGEDHGLNVRTWIRLVQGEITRRNNHPSDDIKTADELVGKKCIDAPFVEGTLTTIRERSRARVDIGFVSKLLIDAGWKQADVSALAEENTSSQQRFLQRFEQRSRSAGPRTSKNKSTIRTGRKKMFRSFWRTSSPLSRLREVRLTLICKPTTYRALGVLIYYEEI